MARLRRRWRVVKWAGLTLAILFGLMWAASLEGSYALERRFIPQPGAPVYFFANLRLNPRGGIAIQAGCLKIYRYAGLLVGVSTSSPDWEPARAEWHYGKMDFFSLGGGIRARLLPYVQRKSPLGVQGFEIGLPLWIAALLFATPACYLFWRDRRIPPHCCQGCGYDLTGNTSGVCPECGATT